MGWNCFFNAKLYLLKFGMDKKFNSTRCNYFSMSVKGGLREAWRPQRWSWVYVMTFWVDPCWCPDDPGRRLISITVSADSGAFFLSNFSSSLLVAMETIGSFIQSRVGRSGCPRELFEQVLERPNTTAASTVRECQCDTASQSLHGDNEWGYVIGFNHGLPCCVKNMARGTQVDKNRGRRPRFLSWLRPEGHVFNIAWQAMIKTYYSMSPFAI